ncbi:HlyD family efflux transporter periplasmic adaptor subunit [Butyricicoccus sp.]|uniref:HlyD family efflux transporter periplasmic adaptor subunit n=1 Tax=Butyricicoccus sp. TaxID=2049021 RepID=UPI003F16E568
MAFKRPPQRRSNSRKKSNVWQIGRLKLNRSLRIPIIAFGLIIIYSVVSFVVNHYNPVKTIPAAQVSMDDSFSTTGYFIRQEKVIDIAEGDTVEYNYSDGDKVSEGTALVTEYANEDALTISRELKNIEENIAQLETLRNVTSTTTNSSQINQKIIDQMNAICEEVESGSLSRITSLASELRQLALKSGSLSNDREDIDVEIASLKTQAADLEERLSGSTTDITSPCSGYFCESVDGYEDIFTPDVVDDLTLSRLNELSDEKPAKTSGKGKVVSSYVWYFAAKVSDTDAKHLTQGNTVKIRFSQASQDVQATVSSIRDDADTDDTLVIFRSQDMNEDLISMRKQVATVVVASYSGLKVPKSAVRMEDDKMGVYVLSNSVASYKNIEPLFEGDSYYIVEQNVTGNDSLVINDDIIVEAKDVNDKKVMK